MYHQTVVSTLQTSKTVVTLAKIASRSSACATRGLNLHSKLRTCGAKESVIAWRNNELQTDFVKTLDGRSLKASSAVLGPLIRSTVRDGALSVFKPYGSVGLDRMFGLKSSSSGSSLFLQNASFLRVPCRTLKSARGKKTEGDKKNSSVIERMRNKVHTASLAVAKFTAPREPEKPKGIGEHFQFGQIMWLTACHESGHILVAHYTKNARQACKVTIVPTETSGGSAHFMPHPGHVTRAQVLADLDMKLGGRAAEEVIFGPDKITHGAQTDLKEATELATSMVKEWGMSEKIGPRVIVDEDMTPAMNELVNQEIDKILQESYERAKKICREHQHELRVLADTLMKHGTLDGDEIKIVLMRAVLQGRV